MYDDVAQWSGHLSKQLLVSLGTKPTESVSLGTL